MKQGDLFDQPEPEPKFQAQSGGVIGEHVRMDNQARFSRRAKRRGPAPDRLSIEQRFRNFHKANPKVYERLAELATGLVIAGHERYSIQGLIEVLRYEEAIGTTREGGFKLNNDFNSRYARMLMDNIPALAGFFETRELKSL